MPAKHQGGELDPSTLPPLDPDKCLKVHQFTYGRDDKPRLADGLQFYAWHLAGINTEGLSARRLAALRRREVISRTIRSRSFINDWELHMGMYGREREFEQLRKLRPRNRELELALTSLTTAYQRAQQANHEQQLHILNDNLAREEEPLYVRFAQLGSRGVLASIKGFYRGQDERDKIYPAVIAADIDGTAGILPEGYEQRPSWLYMVDPMGCPVRLKKG